MDNIRPFQLKIYDNALRVAGEGLFNERVEVTDKGRETHWQNWCSLSAPLGVDPYLQGTWFETQFRCLTGFSMISHTGYYGRGKFIQSGAISSAITAIGKNITMDHHGNPKKQTGTETFQARFQ